MRVIPETNSSCALNYISKFLLQSASHAVVNDSGKKIETIVCYIIFIDTNIALKSVLWKLEFFPSPRYVSVVYISILIIKFDSFPSNLLFQELLNRVIWITSYIFRTFLKIYTRSRFMQHRLLDIYIILNKGNNKITELRTIFQRESQNS